MKLMKMWWYANGWQDRYRGYLRRQNNTISRKHNAAEIIAMGLQMLGDHNKENGSLGNASEMILT